MKNRPRRQLVPERKPTQAELFAPGGPGGPGRPKGSRNARDVERDLYNAFLDVIAAMEGDNNRDVSKGLMKWVNESGANRDYFFKEVIKQGLPIALAKSIPSVDTVPPTPGGTQVNVFGAPGFPIPNALPHPSGGDVIDVTVAEAAPALPAPNDQPKEWSDDFGDKGYNKQDDEPVKQITEQGDPDHG